jgi:hypothetical protein
MITTHLKRQSATFGIHYLDLLDVLALPANGSALEKELAEFSEA